MKMTFYGHFAAGEDEEAIKPLLRHNQAFGVSCILDYSVEEDISQEETEEKETDSCAVATERDGSGTGKRGKQFRVHQGFEDQRDGTVRAHTYFYANEAKCDGHMETFLRTIEASGSATEDSFCAIKFTALGRPQFLMQLSEVLTKWRQFFYQIAAQQGQAGLPATETKLEVAMLQKSLENMGIAVNTDFQSWFTEEMQGLSGTVDLLNWNSLIDNRTKFSKLLLVPNMQTGQLEPLLAHFTEEEDLQLKRILHRTEVLAKRAREVGVRLMMDAEQTYFQPAISHLTVELQRKFNTEKPLIFGTHQCYLKDAYDNVSLDVELARREGWCFGTKLVRGAYMTQERDRAAALGYEDPINPTYEATSTMYHRCLSYVLEEIKHHNQANVMVASHNEDTVKFAIQRMREMGLHPSEKKVSFGQLLSMCDHISFPLGQAGFPVYKYVPFGPVKEVLPYLSRRALENRGIMKGVQRERKLMRTELKRRLFSGNFFYRPKAC
ncbi:proline dehydrogenase 1, mitochondrial-like isoform X1 [Trichosurus vulpecula]|uniref:proline dehydrogenase 1, mitochondrial-like isoform X1 n=1 Tax=Trichosurus vulpecula TaxID=9337 RepID=UPI00186ACC74|nr:proline dehydrogenase 1, mitochondrial-like isoform X1 [Trichosurus vulpecula]